MALDTRFDQHLRDAQPPCDEPERHPSVAEIFRLSAISEQGRQALNEAADLWMALDEHAIIDITDARGRVMFVNDRFCAISQYTRAELLGKDHPFFNSADPSKRSSSEPWKTISSGQVWHGNARLQAKDGSFCWLASTIVPFLDERGVPRKFIAIHSDISEQKRIEVELAERRHLQRLVADLPSRFVSLLPDHIDLAIEETQRILAEALDLDFSVVLQRTEREAATILTHLWVRNRDVALPWQSLREEDLPWPHEKVLHGHTLSFSSTIENLRDANGHRIQRLVSGVCMPLVVNGGIRGALAFGVLDLEKEWREDDIVELQMTAQFIGNIIGRQRAERREGQLRTELAHAMRVATLGEMAASLAHELNQPLAAILSNAQAARRFIANDAITTDELCAIIDDIVRDDKRAGGVLHNLRAMISKGPAVRELCCLNELVTEVADLMHAEIVREEIALRTNLRANLSPVEGARVELQQVLVNLLINAVQAMKDVPSRERILEIETLAESNMAIFSIRDHGQGIPPDRLLSIFEPFFTTKPTGLGMGLSICRRIVEGHGGRIQARNEETGGARFTVWLPATSHPV